MKAMYSFSILAPFAALAITAPAAAASINSATDDYSNDPKPLNWIKLGDDEQAEPLNWI
ncbi:hypothetical protein F9C07_2231489 [Aspergillus flavus]|uniref:Uncharacterized protein n=1 Tax=Aspergillus flavus (strain ATCC 200026 / FGSC A1120 / IAM 13836 / NRRL 3357 / JCM 12722 / SRRC 167) TaxID=332952 RepID=A0A7U2QWA2_ASPFN|nr:hypothetical protein F9C07_2231489 [Aspergillus flavus]